MRKSTFAVGIAVVLVCGGAAFAIKSQAAITCKNPHLYKTVKEKSGQYIKDGGKPYCVNLRRSTNANRGGSALAGVTYNAYWAKVKSDGTLSAAEKIETMPAAMANNQLISQIINEVPKQWSGQTASFNDCWKSSYSTWDGKTERPAPESINQAEYQMKPDIHIDFKLKYIELDVYKWGKFAGKKRIAIETMSGAEYFGHFFKPRQP